MKNILKKAVCIMLVALFSVTNFQVAFALELSHPKLYLSEPTRYASTQTSVNVEDYFDKKDFIDYMVSKLKVTEKSTTGTYKGYVAIDVSLFNIPYSVEVADALKTYIWYESPELFRISSLGMSYDYVNSKPFFTTIYFDEYYTAAEYSDMWDRISEVEDRFLKGLVGNENLSELEKALILHDRIINMADYDSVNYANNSIPQQSYNMYGLIVDRTAVCMGYTLAYDYFLSKVGVESKYCSSNTLNHAWNIVYVDGEPYHVDTTWDDPIGQNLGSVYHDNFMLSTEAFKLTHRADDYITTPTSNLYNNFFWKTSETLIAYIDETNEFYYVDNNNSYIKTISNIDMYSAGGAETPLINLMKYQDGWGVSSEISASGGYYAGNYTMMASNGDEVFYSTPLEVYQINTSTKESVLVDPYDYDEEMTAKETAVKWYPKHYIYSLYMELCNVSWDYKGDMYNGCDCHYNAGIAYHNETENWDVVIAPTQSTEGKRKDICLDCGAVKKTEIMSPLGWCHFGEYEIDPNNPPTCTSKGIEVAYCQDEGCELYTWRYVDALGHDFSADWVIDYPATCKDVGRKSLYCTRCNTIDTNSITYIPVDETKHQKGNAWIQGVEPTCTEEGYLYKGCIHCGKEMEREIRAPYGHIYTDWLLDSGSIYKRTCDVCGYFETKDLACEHDLGEWILVKEPTCVTKGQKVQYCTKCQTLVNETLIASTGHTEVVTGTAIAPTCTKTGLTQGSHCSVCNATITPREIIAAKGHTKVTDKAVSATCTETGLTEGSHCSVCNEVIVAQTVTPATGHSLGNWIIDKNATCTAEGSKYKKCEKCAYKETAIITKIAHKEVALPEVTPTCTESGFTGGTKCSVCQKIIIDRQDVEPLGHKFGNWVTTTPATTEKEGVSTRTCSSCGAKETKAIAKLEKPKTLVTPTVKSSSTLKGIQVSWNAIENASTYTIYRKDYSQKKVSWKAIKKGVTTTSYVDTTAKLGVTYEYTVRAVNGEVMSGYKSAGKVKFDVKPNIKIANASNGIKVSWDLVANATGYTVYRSEYNTKTKKWSSWSNRGTAKAGVSSWTDKKVTSGKQYKYTVRAKNGSFGSSYKSSNTTIFLSQPTVKWANASAGIKVSWSKVSGATGYTVYRSQLVNGKWNGWKNMGTAKSNKSSWVDKSVVSGQTYRYTVRAVNGKIMSTYQSKGSLMYLAQPSVQIANVSTGIQVKWTQSAGATGYTVYRSEYNTKTKKWSSWSNRGTAASSKSSWVDKKVTKGKKYKYTVRAINKNTGAKSTYVASNVITKK